MAVRAASAPRDNVDEVYRQQRVGDDETMTTTGKNDRHTTRRDALFSGVAASIAAASFGASPLPAFAEFQEDTEYMPSLAGKDYGKSKYNYPDFVQTESGIQARVPSPLLARAPPCDIKSNHINVRSSTLISHSVQTVRWRDFSAHRCVFVFDVGMLRVRRVNPICRTRTWWTALVPR